ncbi:hypothetical protein FPRO04_12235 [Fusarium proliferatum]|nr:hypothetical protein FPRO04_12235 [Fusarium proliferatum]
MTVATVATRSSNFPRSSNFRKTSVADGKAFFQQHNDEAALDRNSKIRAMKNYIEMEGYKREIAQLRLKVTAWEDTRRKGEIRCSNGIEQDMMGRHWLVKYLRGTDDKINCLRTSAVCSTL